MKIISHFIANRETSRRSYSLNLQMPDSNATTYRESGVNIEAADHFLESIIPVAKKTHSAECLGSIGGFGALYKVPAGYREPVLVSSTDGVGTKLKLAVELTKHDTIGIDLVAMCVNDIIVHGAKPLFFLDYFATGQLQPAIAREVIQGIGRGCEIAGVALIGGETAELPGIYAKSDYDLAGFAVGIVEQNNIVDGSRICAGDSVIGIASSGFHSNGFSLIRKVVQDHKIPLSHSIGSRQLGEILLAPTKIYATVVQDLLSEYSIHGMAHITGGGLPGNVKRILTDGLTARIVRNSWDPPPEFKWLQNLGNISDAEMLSVFNCGIGYVVVLPANQADEAIRFLADKGFTSFGIGTIVPSVDNNPVQIIHE